MTHTKAALVIFFFLLFAAPAGMRAQVFDSSLETQLDDGGTKKSDKKKDKDVVQINGVFFTNLAIDISAVLILIFLVYYPTYKNQDYIFTFLVFNLVIFILTYVLNEVKISMGAAFGLFAVFSMLRYRTAGISIKDMTYLFIVIAVGLVGAIRLDFYELIILDSLIIVFAWLLECKWILRRELSQNIEYENVELIVPEKREQLIEDLRKRTGLKIHRVVIRKINFLRDTATIRAFFYD
ncbi:MAG TPA: DUF4956 domain-containing protein [Bacteroidales bacterium]|nr:DUF4956 domain-containing protein [Bacteroidales bacterium]